jgi:hypothetical protein
MLPGLRGAELTVDVEAVSVSISTRSVDSLEPAYSQRRGSWEVEGMRVRAKVSPW